MCHQSSGNYTAWVGVFTAGQPRRLSTEEEGISEMRLLRKIHFLPKPRIGKIVMRQTNATGKMKSLLSFWVFRLVWFQYTCQLHRSWFSIWDNIVIFPKYKLF